MAGRFSKKKLGSQSSLREANRANLLESIHKFGAMTQVELAEIMGVSTATISALVHQLSDEGQLETHGTVRNGRRAQLVTLAHHNGLAAGVHITRRGLRVVLCDDTRSPYMEHHYPLARNHLPDTTLDIAARMIRESLEQMDAGPTSCSRSAWRWARRSTNARACSPCLACCRAGRTRTLPRRSARCSTCR
ncbi:MarR family winged helix-turn-helix transcriptional regulator [Bifidobacterium pseudolongum]